MIKFSRLKRRVVYISMALTLALSGVVGVVPLGKVAALQFTARRIIMSSSAVSASGLSYEVGVTPTATGNVLGFVVEFCDNSPIPTDSCTSTPGTDTPNGSSAALSGWTLNGASDGNTLVFTRGSGTFTASTPVTLTITGMANPSSTGTFYARVFSYDTAAKAIGYTSANPSQVGAPVDEGGIALSTAAQLTVTAKVQESLTFTLSTSAISLGDANGVLDAATAYNNESASFAVSSNASQGVIVRMKGSTLNKNDLTCASASNCITETGASAVSSSVGTEQFGMCVSASGGSVTAAAPYNNGNCADGTTGAYSGSAQFAFDTNNTTGTTSTYGDTIAQSSGATATTTGTLVFLGNVSNTTEAGIYTTTLTYIATGTY